MSLEPHPGAADRSGHLTELTLNRYLYDPPDASLSATVDAHLAACIPCREALAVIRAEDAEALAPWPLPRAHPPISLDAARRRRGPWVAAAGVIALAAAVLLVARPWADPSAGGVRLRGGGIGLQVFVHDGVASREVTTGDIVRTGERFRFAVTLREAGDVMIVGVDQEQRMYPCYPQTAGRSVPREAGGPHMLDVAMAFDAVLGQERIVAIRCADPFDYHAVRDALRTVDQASADAALLSALRPGCDQAEVTLLKVAARP